MLLTDNYKIQTNAIIVLDINVLYLCSILNKPIDTPKSTYIHMYLVYNNVQCILCCNHILYFSTKRVLSRSSSSSTTETSSRQLHYQVYYHQHYYHY